MPSKGTGIFQFCLNKNQNIKKYLILCSDHSSLNVLKVSHDHVIIHIKPLIVSNAFERSTNRPQVICLL